MNKAYSGGAFHTSLPKGRATGNVQVTHSGIEFYYENTPFSLLIKGLRIRRGGAANRLVFFDNPGVEGLTIYSSDETILNNPVFQARSDLIQQIKKLRSGKWKTSLIIITALIIFITLLVGLFHLKEPFVGVIAEKIPPDWEEEFGDAMFRQVIGPGQILKDDKITDQLQIITTPIIQAIPDNPYNFRFHIVEDSQVNALAIPGGNVIIYSGLLVKADSPEEIAGVLAHEIAHVTRKHSIRQVIGTTGVYLLVQSVFGDLSGLLAVIADSSTFLLTRTFSREYEREADETGWDYLIKANINPEGMVSFFEKLKAIEDSKYNSSGTKIINESLNFLSTHPATEDRIQYFKEKLGTLSAANSFITFKLDFPQFKERIRSSTSISDKKKSIPDTDESLD